MLQKIDKALLEQAVESAKVRGCFEALPKRMDDTHRALPNLDRAEELIDRQLYNLLRGLLGGLKPWPLYLHGDVGTGKTRAVLCLCDIVQLSRYWTVSGLMDSMIAKDPPWEWPISPALPVLDELGLHDTNADRRGEFEFDAIKRWLDWREDRPAVYVSNHPLEEMTELYDRRIKSRLGVGTVFELKGPDRRKSVGRLPEGNT